MHPLRVSLILTLAVLLGRTAPTGAQDTASSVPVFRTTTNLVSLSAVVRDRSGRIARALGSNDFEVRENGRLVPLIDVRSERDVPAHIALVVDGSGSMKLHDSFGLARDVSKAILRSLDARDQAALYSFDTRLLTLQAFTSDLDRVGQALGHLEAWGSTSLYDAIGGVAGKIHERGESRRAIVVFTDGNDTTSTMSAADIATMTSALDVPVYAFALGPGQGAGQNPEHEPPLRQLAQASGGIYFESLDPVVLASQVAMLIEELRHQHVLAFEASTEAGWRSLELRVRRRGFKVRTRGWYWAGDAVAPVMPDGS